MDNTESSSLLADISGGEKPAPRLDWRKLWRHPMLRVSGWILLILGIVCGILFGLMRFWLFPWLGEHREWVAARLSDAVGAPVSIEQLRADWQGLMPRLQMNGVTIQAGDHEVLRLAQMEATLSWWSVPRWMPYFHALEIVGPEIELMRGEDGVLTVAGIRMEPDAEKSGHTNPIVWLFEQSRIAIRDGVLIWNDSLRGAPPLRLTDVQFGFEHGIFNNHVEFRARPPEALATRLDMYGDVRSYDPTDLEKIAGRISVGLEGQDLGGWSTWVDYPVPFKGRGKARLWFDSDGGGITGVSADLDMEGVETVLAPGLTPLRFDRLGGRVLVRRGPGSMGLGARGLWMVSRELNMHIPTDFDIDLRYNPDETLAGGSISFSSLDFAVLTALTDRLPLSQEVRAQLSAFNPRGQVRDLSISWTRGEDASLSKWMVNAALTNFSLDANGLIPGMSNVSGSISGDERSGTFSLSILDGYLDFPKVFERSRIALTSLDASGGWGEQDGSFAVAVRSVRFTNAEAEGSLSGRYWPEHGGPGKIDIAGGITRAKGEAVWYYLPLVIGPNVPAWMSGALQRGSITDLKVELKGPLHFFPFRHGEGNFLVTLQANDAVLRYASGWPALEGLSGTVSIRGPELTVEARNGRILGVQTKPLRVHIADLGKGVLNIDGTATGASTEFLRFLAESPLRSITSSFTESLRAEGNGQLDLSLVIPVRELDDIEVSGQYRFANNRVRLDWAPPALESAGGNLSFTRDGIQSLSIQGRLLGGASTLEGKTVAGNFEMNARGQAHATAVQEAFGWPLLGWLGGETPWRAEISLARNNSKVVVRSGLQGLRSRLPAPFAKEAEAVWPLEVISVARAGQSRQTTAKVDGWLEVVIEQDASGNVRSGLGLNRPAPRDAYQGLLVAVSLDALDLDAWQWSLGSQADAGTAMDISLPSGTLDVKRLRAFGYTFNDLKLQATNGAEKWVARIDSSEAQGSVSWQRAGDGMLTARLSRLSLTGGGDNDAVIDPPAPPRSLPGLDVQAEEFAVGTRVLGKLDVRATNQEGVWRLEQFAIQQPHAQFSGHGIWQPVEQHSAMEFTLDTADVGQFAATMGYEKVVRGEHATLSGNLNWSGAPTSINFKTLSGQIKVAAQKGRFERIEPGVGRLLGVLSLQALPRRVTLDFQDVFSEGFSFDSIKGKAAISNGIMKTDNVEIVGPAARIVMKGVADINAETQDLLVNVQPAMSESVAIGAAVVNPVAGAVTYVVQKALGNPLGKLFSYDYKITGTWADPVIEKGRTIQIVTETDGVRSVLQPDQ